jgi:hypothetical protein
MFRLLLNRLIAGTVTAVLLIWGGHAMHRLR